MMKKRAILPFQLAPSPSLSTIRDIREIRSLTSTTPSPLSKNKPRPTIRVHLTHMYLTFVAFEKFVVFQLKSPPPCQIISPLHPYRLHRLPLCTPFEKFEKFVVFQVLVRFYSIEKV